APPERLTDGAIDVGALSADRDARRFALLIGSATELSDVFVMEAIGRSAGVGRRVSGVGGPVRTGGAGGPGAESDTRRLTDFNRPFLDEVYVGVPEELVIPAADGVEVQGWLLKPPGYEAGHQY